MRRPSKEALMSQHRCEGVAGGHIVRMCGRRVRCVGVL